MARKPKHWSEAATEAEEARWWDEHPEYVTKMMKKGIADGTAIVGKRAVAVVDKAPTKSVSIRLAVSDIEAARGLAEKKGLPYQTYMKMLLHQALSKERRAS
jgi:predicted DNA binding CopG/RHH family protein